jgi:hypothetical protein
METSNECKQFDDFKKEIDTLIEGMRKDAEKFYNNDNKAAAVRLRKAYKTIKQFVHETSNSTLPNKVKK